MHIPDEPPIGNLVAYEYLWLSQKGTREDGAKVYPVALIFAKKIVASVTLAYAVGMSHKPPAASEKALEVPRAVKPPERAKQLHHRPSPEKLVCGS